MPKRSDKGKGWRVKFDSTTLEGKMLAGVVQGLGQGAAFLAGEMKKDVSLPGPPPRTVTPRQRAARFKRAEKLGQVLRHSKPGEPPRLITGTLRASISNEPLKGGLLQRVGTPLKYGFWLEFGTLKMAPRPWLRVNLVRNLDRIKQLIFKSAKEATK